MNRAEPQWTEGRSAKKPVGTVADSMRVERREETEGAEAGAGGIVRVWAPWRSLAFFSCRRRTHTRERFIGGRGEIDFFLSAGG